jgi:hypothetical protein
MIQVENINVPGRTSNVNAEKYEAMRDALMQALPGQMPGLTQAEMLQAVLPFLPETLFPNGEKSGWWVKTVQLDLEAKGVVKRDTSGKLNRWYRA